MSDEAAGSRWGARSIAALLIFILAAALTPVALVGHWGHRTVIDSARYIDTVGPLVSTPEVQEAIADAVTDAVIEQVDTTNQVEGLLGNLFPDSQFTGQLAAPIAAGINSAIGELVSRFVASDQFQTLWIELNTRAQAGIVRVLEGENDGTIRLVGDDVVLDISSLLAEVQTFLVNQGITAAGNITVPETDRQIVLMNAPALAQARFIYTLTSPILQWFPILIAALFALAIWLSRRRARMVVATGIALFLSGSLLWIGLSTGETVFVDQLQGTVFASAAQTFWATLFLYLVEGLKALLLLSVAIIFGGWLGGRTASAQVTRGHLVKGLGELSVRMPDGLAGFGAGLRGSASAIRWAIFALGLIVILLSDVLSPASILWTVALVAGLLTLLQLLLGTPDDEAPSAAPAEDVATNA
jgi:hypothetical protein